ncbi:MAG: hypothetical protein IPJ77_13835 [Planctomycetes bacterium]|nr:hypothetical protein [Planctomycetota bacterium]
MSAPSPRPANTWRVLVAFASLAALAGTFGFVLLAKTGETEPAKVLEPVFTVRELPFGFVPRFAAELPFGQKLVRLAPPGVELGLPEAERAATAQTPPSEPDAEPKIAWRKLAIAPAGAPPREAALVFLADATRDTLRPYFEDPSWRALGDLGDAGGWVAVDAGTMTWAAFEPRYVILRHFEAPGVYSDHARVDLSAHGRGCVLCVDWSRGATASREALVELARAFEPKPKAAP